MNLSIIVPVHNGGPELGKCLQALFSSKRPADEVIVVDDCSTDLSAEVARGWDAHELTLSEGPHGPAVARNRGASVARGDILVFIDADVMVHANTLSRIAVYLEEHPDLDALFGSYDDAPPERSLVTLYKNLQHHYVHQHSRKEASTFWAGCGAIRRKVFLEIGGFDESYTRPSIEDIELGVRLRRSGHRVWLCPDVQVAHLKRWTLKSLLRADILNRAVPWTELILSSAELPADLNLDVRSRASAFVAWAVLFSTAIVWWLPWACITMGIGIGALVLLNADLYRFFAQKGGLGFAVGAFGLHTLYFLYSSLVFGSLLVWRRVLRITRAKVKGATQNAS